MAGSDMDNEEMPQVSPAQADKGSGIRFGDAAAIDEAGLESGRAAGNIHVQAQDAETMALPEVPTSLAHCYANQLTSGLKFLASCTAAKGMPAAQLLYTRCCVLRCRKETLQRVSASPVVCIISTCCV